MQLITSIRMIHMNLACMERKIGNSFHWMKWIVLCHCKEQQKESVVKFLPIDYSAFQMLDEVQGYYKKYFVLGTDHEVGVFL